MDEVTAARILANFAKACEFKCCFTLRLIDRSHNNLVFTNGRLYSLASAVHPLAFKDGNPIEVRSYANAVKKIYSRLASKKTIYIGDRAITSNDDCAQCFLVECDLANVNGEPKHGISKGNREKAQES